MLSVVNEIVAKVLTELKAIRSELEKLNASHGKLLDIAEGTVTKKPADG